MRLATGKGSWSLGSFYCFRIQYCPIKNLKDITDKCMMVVECQQGDPMFRNEYCTSDGVPYRHRLWLCPCCKEVLVFIGSLEAMVVTDLKRQTGIKTRPLGVC